MKYDKIRAESAAECMMKVRGQYGSSAMILQTREVKEGGIFGFMAKPMYEVYFMVEESQNSRKYPRRSEFLSGNLIAKEKAASTGVSGEKNSREEITETFDRLQKKKDRLTALIAKKSDAMEKETFSEENIAASSLLKTKTQKSESPGHLPSVDAIPITEIPDSQITISGEEMHALMKWRVDENIPTRGRPDEKNGLENSMGHPHSADSFSMDRSERNIHRIRKMLLGSQMSSEFTETFIRSLDHELSRKEKNEFKLMETKAFARLAEVIRMVPDIAPPRGECKAVMLIGPTGSGKTTSIAKLAARFHLMEKRDVSLYSLDHYRLAATEQLKIYADVMSVPFFAPVTPEEFQEFLKRDGAEIMLIDTSGIGISDKNRLYELKKFVEACNVRLEKHLVIAANTSSTTVEKIIQAYDESIGFDKILLTKVDETDFFGSFIEFADKFNRPFSFLTNGQEVPGDLLAPKPEELARMALGEALHTVS
jgi:flagellar biosynthesis protein FlhF